jgi:hypothetical protein
MANIYEIIALRALNATKTVNPITYLGIRCFLDSFSNEFDENGLEHFIRHKLKVRQHWFTWEHKIYKEINDKDEFDYRDFISLSPFGVISEAFLLRELLNEKCFDHKENVYSYMPSKNNSNRNFKYYFEGYKNRGEKIKEEIKKNKQLNILVLDLKAFYPSIDKDNLLELIEKLQERGLSENSYKIIINLTKSLLNQSDKGVPKGVPIGTDLSHFIAQIYLHDFDIQLIEKFNSKYFRYVDDIIIFGDSNKIESIKTIVENALPDELKINHSKTSLLTSDEWKKMHSSCEDKDVFHDTLKWLTGYLAVHSDHLEKIESLKNKLKEKSINVPLMKIQNQSKSKNWIYYLIKGNIIYYIKLLHLNEDYFISKFCNIKEQYLNDIYELLENNYFTDENDAKNRIKVQKLRSVISRLLYLLPPNELEEIGERLPKINKISDLQVIINAIIKIDLIPAFNYCGKPIQTICEIWGEADLGVITLSKQDFMKIDKINEIIDSILIMRLYGVIDFNFMELSSLLNERNQKYCAVVLGYSVNLTEEEKKNSYLSELYGLFKGKTLEEKREYLTTRFDQEEGLGLAGLNLGFGYSL